MTTMGAIHVSVSYPRDQVSRSGSEGRQADARMSSEATVDIRHERSALLVARQNETNGRILEGHHEMGVLLARDTKHRIDLFVFEAADKQLGGFHKFS